MEYESLATTAEDRIDSDVASLDEESLVAAHERAYEQGVYGARVVILCGLLFPVGGWWVREKIWEEFTDSTDDDIIFLSPLGLYLESLLFIVVASVVSFSLRNIPNQLVGCPKVNKRRILSIAFTGFFFKTQAVEVYEKYVHLDGSDVMFPQLAQCADRENGLKEEIIKKVFEGSFALRSLKTVLFFCKVILNATFMYINVVCLPERDPREPLNEARYRVVYLEGTVLVCYLVAALYSLIKRHARSFTRRCECAAEWSALTLLRQLNIQIIARSVSDTKLKHQISGSPIAFGLSAGPQIIWCVSVGLVGVVVLSIKIQQLDFVSEEMVWDYRLIDWIRLFAFALNILSIYDIGDVQKDAIQRFLVDDYEYALTMCDKPSPIWKAWETFLADRATSALGKMRSLMVLATYDADDLRKLLLAQNDYSLYEPPFLLKALLTEDRKPNDYNILWATEWGASGVPKWLENRRLLTRTYLRNIGSLDAQEIGVAFPK